VNIPCLARQRQKEKKRKKENTPVYVSGPLRSSRGRKKVGTFRTIHSPHCPRRERGRGRRKKSPLRNPRIREGKKKRKRKNAWAVSREYFTVIVVFVEEKRKAENRNAERKGAEPPPVRAE